MKNICLCLVLATTHTALMLPSAQQQEVQELSRRLAQEVSALAKLRTKLDEVQGRLDAARHELGIVRAERDAERHVKERVQTECAWLRSKLQHEGSVNAGTIRDMVHQRDQLMHEYDQNVSARRHIEALLRKEIAQGSVLRAQLARADQLLIEAGYRPFGTPQEVVVYSELPAAAATAATAVAATRPAAASATAPRVHPMSAPVVSAQPAAVHPVLPVDTATAATAVAAIQPAAASATAPRVHPVFPARAQYGAIGAAATPPVQASVVSEWGLQQMLGQAEQLFR